MRLLKKSLAAASIINTKRIMQTDDLTEVVLFKMSMMEDINLLKLLLMFKFFTKDEFKVILNKNLF